MQGDEAPVGIELLDGPRVLGRQSLGMGARPHLMQHDVGSQAIAVVVEQPLARLGRGDRPTHAPQHLGQGDLGVGAVGVFGDEAAHVDNGRLGLAGGEAALGLGDLAKRLPVGSLAGHPEEAQRVALSGVVVEYLPRGDQALVRAAGLHVAARQGGHARHIVGDDVENPIEVGRGAGQVAQALAGVGARADGAHGVGVRGEQLVAAGGGLGVIVPREQRDLAQRVVEGEGVQHDRVDGHTRIIHR